MTRQHHVLDDTVRAIVALACRAPSVHNTQPWRWVRVADGVELHADPTRALGASDPRGRNLVISCGAALHHAQVVARALGWQAEVQHVPDGAASDLLARVVLAPGSVPDDAAQVLAAVQDRRTDRRRFTSWPMPDAQLHALARVASAAGAHAVPVVDVTDRFRVDRLVERARDRQARDARVGVEQLTWVDHGPADGVPSTVLPGVDRSSSVARTSRFGAGVLDDPVTELESSDGLVVLCGYDDARPDWLRTGEALSALWLRATRDGLSVVPLSQVVEVEETRLALQHDVLGDLAAPHLLVRLGWQSIGRSQLVRTARRPLDEVLVEPHLAGGPAQVGTKGPPAP